MSNTVGAILMSVVAAGSISYMAYSHYSGGGSGSGQAEPPKQELKVQLPAFKESIKFTVLKTESELVDALAKHRVVYDPTQISYAMITKPGQCEVFMLFDHMSKTVSDYDIARCQHMLDYAASKANNDSE